MRFYGLVHKDEDSAFGVSFPDLPGCFSAADDEAAIEVNAIEALALWFEDEAIVKPRGLSALQADPGVARELAAGAFLISVPYIPDDSRAQRINITIPRGLLVALDEEAARRRVNRSSFIAKAVRENIATG